MNQRKIADFFRARNSDAQSTSEATPDPRTGGKEITDPADEAEEVDGAGGERRQAPETEPGSGAGAAATDATPPPSKKRQTAATASYDYEARRVRGFVQTWVNKFPWVVHDDERDVMTCSVCTEFATSHDDVNSPFVKGTSVYRISMVQSHNKSKQHSKSLDARRAKTFAAPSTLPRCVNRLEAGEVKKLKYLLNTAFFVAKEELPFTKFGPLIKLQHKNDLDLGSMYSSDNACRRFTEYIYEDVMSPIWDKMKKAKYISILVDSSTDSSNKDLELIYVRFVDAGLPVNALLGLEELKHATAIGHLAALQAGVESHIQEWQNSIVGLGTDGAATMIGKTGGLAALLRREIPWLCNIHCMAHRLELSVADALKEERQMQQVISMLEGMYKTFKTSPKAWRELRSVAAVLETRAYKPGNVQGTRWMPHIRSALSSVTKNYVALIAQHENMIEQNAGSADMRGRARQTLKLLKDEKNLMFMHFTLDILESLSRLSCKLQADSLNVADALNHLNSTTLSLTAMKTTPAPHLATLLGELNDSTYMEVSLTPCGQQGRDAFDNLRSRVLETVILHLCDRFESLQAGEILASSTIIDVRKWPLDDEEALATYGNAALSELCDHFKDILEAKGCDILAACHVEWYDLKNYMRHVPAQQRKHIWQVLLTDPAQERFGNILHIVEIVMVLPLSTAACERGFSLMKRIKTDWRSSLSVPMLLKLMGISVNGPAVPEYDPTGAVERWLRAGNRHVTSK